MNAAEPPAANIAAPGVLPGGLLENAAIGSEAVNATASSYHAANAAARLGAINAPAFTVANIAKPSITAAHYANAAIPGVPAAAAIPSTYHAADSAIPAIPAIPAVYHAADSAIPADPGVTQRAAPGTAVEAAAIPAKAPLRLASALMAAAR